MDLMPVIQSKVNQKEKNKYIILKYSTYFNIYGIQKMVLMNLFAGKEWRHRYREKTYGHSEERKEWDEQRKQQWTDIQYHV